jgi:hypothetical protein
VQRLVIARTFEPNSISRKTEVRREIGAKDLRQQGNGIKRDGQTSPARDHRRVVG